MFRHACRNLDQTLYSVAHTCCQPTRNPAGGIRDLQSAAACVWPLVHSPYLAHRSQVPYTPMCLSVLHALLLVRLNALGHLLLDVGCVARLYGRR